MGSTQFDDNSLVCFSNIKFYSYSIGNYLQEPLMKFINLTTCGFLT